MNIIMINSCLYIFILFNETALVNPQVEMRKSKQGIYGARCVKKLF